MQLTVVQCRAARALLDWSVAELANTAGVGTMTVKRFEGAQVIRAESIDKLVTAFTAAGVTFIAAGESSSDGGEGVRLATSDS